MKTKLAILFLCTALSLAAETFSLTWADNSTDETGFKIERAVGNGPFVEIGTVKADTPNFSDETVKPGITYSYRVRAYNAIGDSPYSNTLTKTVPGAVGQAPQNITIEARIE